MGAAPIGREDERAEIAGFLHEAKAGPAALVLEGEPGIGKSVLWKDALRTVDDVRRVLASTPSSSEPDLAFSVVGDLFEADLDLLDPLPAPRRPLTDGDVSKRMVLNIDLTPTIARLAGVDASGTDGRSFVRLLRRPRAAWRRAFLIEHYGSTIPTYCAVRTTSWIYVRYATGEREVYSLSSDPHQLKNRIRAVVGTWKLAALKVALGRLCSPPPPTLRLP